MQPIKTAFFSGTFNPVHTGHLILANYLCEYEDSTKYGCLCLLKILYEKNCPRIMIDNESKC